MGTSGLTISVEERAALDVDPSNGPRSVRYSKIRVENAAPARIASLGESALHFLDILPVDLRKECVETRGLVRRTDEPPRVRAPIRGSLENVPIPHAEA